MTRPSDAAIARAFWAYEDALDLNESDLTLVRMIKNQAKRFDAETPAGTARGSEEVMPNVSGLPDESAPVVRGEDGKASPPCTHLGCSTPTTPGPCAFAGCPRK